MKSSSNIPQGKSPDYLQLLRFCRTGSDVTEPNSADKLYRVTVALNNLLSTPLPVRSLLPLIYKNAKNSGIFHKLEPDIQNFIKSHAMILVAEELAKERWLRGAIRIFEEKNIPIILLKGAAFSGYLYSADAPRPGVDVDFLVRERDFDKTCYVLDETMNPVLLAEDRLATHRTLFERVYVSKTRSSPMAEVHRGLTNPYIFTIDEKRLWGASEIHPKYKSESVRMLSPEDTLLHLAVHAFRDMDFCNHNLLDAHQWICLRGISEEKLIRSATNWGAKAVLFYLMLNAKQIMGTHVQQSFLDQLRPWSTLKRLQEALINSSAVQTDKSISYRTAQAASQLLLPDKITSAMKFQAYYAKTRIMDLIS